MNLNSKLQELEHFFQQDLIHLMPVTVLSDNSLAYKKYRILKNKLGFFELRYLKTGDFINQFRTKTSALLAAKFYDKHSFSKYNEVVSLDQRFYNNFTDSEIFKYRIRTTKNLERKDLFRWRYELTNSRARMYKNELTQMFKTHF